MTVRPPIVTVMGHVDHGKSTLIETLRQINITGKEAVGHIKEAKVPFLVAINKIDLPEANVEKVKAQLAENEVYVEGYGGDVVCVPISAKNKQNLDQLLEMVLLMAEMQELKSDPTGELEAVVIEAKLDPEQGPVATLLMKNGTLKIGQTVWAEAVEGKARALVNDAGKRVDEAVPGQPVAMVGFKAVPAVGAQVRSQRLAATPGGGQASELGEQKSEENKIKLKLIIKADVAGSLEAIRANMSDYVEIIDAGVGEVGEADVLLAESTGAKIIAFNVSTIKTAARLAETEDISIKTHRIIYELLEDVAKQVGKLVEPTIDETEVGQAVIKAEFEIKANRIAGCQVSSGVLATGMLVHMKREGQPVGDSKIASLQQGKEKVKQVGVGGECGVAFSPALDFKIGDVLISYRKLSVEE